MLLVKNIGCNWDYKRYYLVINVEWKRGIGKK